MGDGLTNAMRCWYVIGNIVAALFACGYISLIIYGGFQTDRWLAGFVSAGSVGLFHTLLFLVGYNLLCSGGLDSSSCVYTNLTRRIVLGCGAVYIAGLTVLVVMGAIYNTTAGVAMFTCGAVALAHALVVFGFLTVFEVIWTRQEVRFRNPR